ncbi:transglycosylase SLT domain-containing protein, partial [Tetragenococcus halophilus]|uniref:transglycosylase SLT domain-containing protein n=1 Tax=Tetragenococcus halophilus TaxID=51669 RepID=UPI0030C9B298
MAELRKQQQIANDPFTKVGKNMEQTGQKIQDTGKKVSSVGKKWTRATSFVASGVAALGGGLLGLTKRATESADEIAKGAEKMGVSTDFYQESAYWASQNGISQEQMEKAVGRLNQRMGKAVDGNEKYAKALGNLGVDLGAVEDGSLSTEDAMAQSITTLSEMDNEHEKAALATEMFGTRMARDLLPALNDGSLSMEEAREKAQELGLVMGGEQLEKAEAFQDSMDDVKRSLSAVGMEIGLELMPYFQQMLDWIIDHMPQIRETITNTFDSAVEKVSSFVDWWTGLSSTTQKVIKSLVGVAVAMGPLLSIIGPIGTGVGFLVQGTGLLFQSLGRVSGAIKNAGGMLAFLKTSFAAINWPVVLTITAIASVTAGLVALYKRSETFRNVVNGAVEAVKNKFFQLKEVVSTLFSLFTGGINFEEAKQQLNGVVSESTVQRFQSVHDFIEKIKLAFEALGAVISDEAGIGQLKNLFGDTFSDETLDRILIVGETVRNFVEMVKEKFAEFAKMISQAFQGNFEPLLGFIQELIPKIVMILIGGLPLLIYTGMNLITKLAEGMGVSVPELIEKVTGIITTMLTKFTEALPRIIETGANIILKLINGFTQMLPNLIEAATGIISTILQTISEILPQIIDAGITILTSLIQGIVNALPQIIEAVIKVIDTLTTQLTEMLPVIIDAGIKILMALIDGLIKILPKLIDAGLKIIMALFKALIDNLPRIIKAGVKLLLALIDGLIKILPKLIDAGFKIIMALFKALIDNLPQIIDAGVKILFALIDGIIDILPQLIEAGLKIIMSLFKALIENLPQIIKAGVKLLFALIDGLIKTIPDLVAALPEIFDAIFDAFAEVDWLQLGMDILKGIMKGLKSMAGDLWDSVKEVGGKIKDGFKDFFGIHSPSRVMADLAKFLPEGIAKGITDNQEVVAQAMKMLNGMIKNSVQQSATVDVQTNTNQDDGESQANSNPLQKMMAGFTEQIPQAREQVKKFIAQWNQLFIANDEVMFKIGFNWLNRLLQGANEAYPKIVERVKQLINQINTIVKNNYKSMYKQGRTTLQKLLDGFNSLYGNTINRVKQLIAQVNRLIKDNNKPMYNQGRAWLQRLLDGFNSLYSQMIDRIKQLISQINKLIQNNNKPMYNQGRKWLQELRDGFNSLYDSFINLINKLCSEAVDKLRGKHGDFYDAGKYLISGLKDGISAMKGPIGDIMNDVANKMIGGIANGVSGVRSGVNHILKEVDSDKRIDEWDVPKYAKGTKGHPQDGPALVNDQKGPNYREIVQNPGEKPVMYKDRNVMAPLKKGASVIKASVSKKIAKGQSIPHYKDGTDDTDVFDLVDDKGKFSKLIKGKINLDDFGEPWKDMSKKASQMMIDAAYDMVEEEAGAMFGEFDGDIYNGSITDAKGVYSYLVDIAKRVIDKFPGMSITSGYRPGDRYYHGKRQAIDLAYPASDNGSSKYKEPANWVFKKFKDQVAYVIALNKIKDRTGMGGEGKTMSWANWPSGGHMDHLHLNGMFGPGDVGKGPAGGEDSISGSGVGRWKNTAIRALKMTGDYSKQNLNLLMNQMKKESNGNPKAINNWDANAKKGTPSKGLMQVIQPTFDSYKMKGHGNILKPLDNILAAIRYTKSAYGSLKSGWRGVGYENGGLVSRHQIAEMGEGNKPEMVLPLTNKARSLDLMAKAMHIMGVDDKNASSSSSFSLSVVTELLQ